MRQVVITEHAKKRMVERGVCKEPKVKKIALKAWKNESNARKLDSLIYTKTTSEDIRIREYQGFVYIFDIQRVGKTILKTVYTL